MLSFMKKIFNSKKNNENPFGTSYRKGYNKLWINTLKKSV